jgi:hypothetical protein
MKTVIELREWNNNVIVKATVNPQNVTTRESVWKILHYDADLLAKYEFATFNMFWTALIVTIDFLCKSRFVRPLEALVSI